MNNSESSPAVDRSLRSRTLLITDPEGGRHTLPGHPEHAGRMTATLRRLEQTGVRGACVEQPARVASREQIELAHSPEVWDRLRQIERRPGTNWLDRDSYANQHSLEAARRSAGAALQAAEQVLQRSATNALALVRPPGHHATASRSMGFCLFNNVAVAACWARRELGAERVFILDFDVHHGNGTQDIFYADPSVMYVSLHQHPLFPMSGRPDETGAGSGIGFTCNLALPPGAGDRAAEQLLERIVLPLGLEFNPDLVLVSAGFDGHWRDPLAHLLFSLTGLNMQMRAALELARKCAGGRLVTVLEGGYDLEVLGCGVHNVLSLMLGRDEVLDPFGPADGLETDISPLLAAASELWAGV